MTGSGMYNNMHMGNTVKSSQGVLNRFINKPMNAAQSHLKASKAWDEGWFDWETFPVSIPQRRGDPIVLIEMKGFVLIRRRI